MEEERSDLPLRRLSLIDFSLENDALVFSTSSPLRGPIAENDMGLFECLGEPYSDGKEMGLSLTPDGGQEDQFPDLMKSTEPDRSSWKSKCNLRKSLAWDNAFFTNAGVLDAEELSCMMEGAEKSGKKLLPGIEEDIRESYDSVSTLESDNLVLENLEAELFHDIRASIQRSSKSYAATSGQANLGESKTISSKKKMTVASQNQKHTPESKKPIGAPKPPIRQSLRAPGIAKSVNLDARRSKVEQSTRPGNPNSTLKPPRIISITNPSMMKPNTTPTAKRASLAASDVKKMGLQNMTTAADNRSGKVPPASKAPIVARRLLPRPTLSSKASSFGSSNSTKSAASSLTDSSGSVSTEKMSKSNVVPAQRKVGGKTANSPAAASSSSLKTPLKTASRNATTSRNSAVSAYLMSSKISSSMSPANSNNELSSASSSSSVTFLRSKSRASFDTSSCRSSLNDTITSDLSSEMLDKDADKGGRSARKSTAQTGLLSSLDSARPSGLKLPSQKFGYFDGAKSNRTPNGSRQSQLNPAMLPKTGAAVPSPRRSSSVKPKSVKSSLSHAKAVSASPKMKPQELTSPMPYEKVQTPQHSGKSDVGSHSISCSFDLKRDEGSCVKVEEVGSDQANHAKSASVEVEEVVKNADDLSLMRTDVNEAVTPGANKAVALGDLYGCDSEKREILKSWEKVDAVDLAIDGASLVDAATDNMVGAVADTSYTEKRELSKPLENVDKDVPESMPSVLRVDEKENVVIL